MRRAPVRNGADIAQQCDGGDEVRGLPDAGPREGGRAVRCGVEAARCGGDAADGKLLREAELVRVFFQRIAAELQLQEFASACSTVCCPWTPEQLSTLPSTVTEPEQKNVRS